MKNITLVWITVMYLIIAFAIGIWAAVLGSGIGMMISAGNVAGGIFNMITAVRICVDFGWKE